MQPKLYLFLGCSEILEYSVTRETWGRLSGTQPYQLLRECDLIAKSGLSATQNHPTMTIKSFRRVIISGTQFESPRSPSPPLTLYADPNQT